MDPLTQALLQRQLAGGTTPTPLPMLPNPSTKVPQKEKRFENAQAIEQAYQGNWTPNPVLLRAQLGHT